MDLEFAVRPRDGDVESVSLSVDRVVNCGLTGPDEEVARHIEELEKEGISVPDELPAMYPLPHQYLLQCSTVQVLSDSTSGEAEFVLLPTDDEVYVGVGSDHTDRALERDDVPLSKVVCPNVIGNDLWRLSDVERHWGAIELRSWTGTGRVEPYQRATVDQIMDPRELLETVDERLAAPLVGTAVFSGTVSTQTRELVYGDVFAVNLQDPILGRGLTVEYDVVGTDWFNE